MNGFSEFLIFPQKSLGLLGLEQKSLGQPGTKMGLIPVCNSLCVKLTFACHGI